MGKFAKVSAAALGVLAVLCAVQGDAAAAASVTVPEIDATVVPAAVGVITAGVLMLRARRGSK